MIREWCGLRGWWWALVSRQRVSGHVWKQQTITESCTVIEERCETCGRVQVVWHQGKADELRHDSIKPTSGKLRRQTRLARPHGPVTEKSMRQHYGTSEKQEAGDE